MDITTVAAWTALCMQCAPGIHPATTIAIVKTESGGNPYAIGDNNTKKTYSPKSQREAVSIAYELLKKGHSIDMGLMQVNSTHLKKANFKYYDLFDPCFNMYTGSKILTEFYRKHDRPNQNAQTTLLKALSSYNTGSPLKGYYNGYVSKILKNTNPAFVYFNQNTYNAKFLRDPSKSSGTSFSKIYPIYQERNSNDSSQEVLNNNTDTDFSNIVQTQESMSFNKSVKTEKVEVLHESVTVLQSNDNSNSANVCNGDTVPCEGLNTPNLSNVSDQPIISNQSNVSSDLNLPVALNTSKNPLAFNQTTSQRNLSFNKNSNSSEND